MSTKIAIDTIELDETAQCRAEMQQDVIDDYAEHMKAGDTFPPVDVFGTKKRCWLGDGWYRVSAARKIGRKEIDAILHPGGRSEAIKFALGANATHGLRRTSADKRRAIEVALQEFPNLSSRAIADLCGVDHKTVEKARPTPQVGKTPNRKTPPQKRKGKDGKSYLATKPKKKEDTGSKKRVCGPPCIGMELARIAVMRLEEIQPNDTEREKAFESVREWIFNEQIKEILATDSVPIVDQTLGDKKANKEMTRLLVSVLAGLERTVKKISRRKVVSACSKDEIEVWIDDGKTSVNVLAGFFENLSRVWKNKNKPPKKKGG